MKSSYYELADRESTFVRDVQSVLVDLNQLYRHGRTISEFYPLRQLRPFDSSPGFGSGLLLRITPHWGAGRCHGPAGGAPPGSWENLSEQCEIDLAAKRVDARDSNAHVVAQAELAAVAAAFDEVFFLVVVVVCEESEAD